MHIALATKPEFFSPCLPRGFLAMTGRYIRQQLFVSDLLTDIPPNRNRYAALHTTD